MDTDAALGAPQEEAPRREPRAFRYEGKGPGRAFVELDGRDISKHVYGVHIHAEAGRDLPQVVIELAGNATVETAFEGLAEVAVINPDPEPLDPGPAAAVFLAAMDPEELERAAMNRIDLTNDRAGGTAAILRQLIEWANGRP